MTDVLALDDEVVCKEEERDEYAPLLTDDYEVKEGILNVDGLWDFNERSPVPTVHGLLKIKST